MNTVTDLSDLQPRIVRDLHEIERLRWFQLHRYVDGGLLDEVPAALPADGSVEASTYFGVYTGDAIQATARIVRASSGLPMLEHHVLYPSVERELEAASGTVAEVSRLAVGNTTPHYRALAILSREFLRFGLRNQHATLLIASVEKPLVRILNRMLGVPLQIIGPSIESYGAFNGECVPILIDTVACLDKFRRQESRRWEFFMDGLVIDLTDTEVAGEPAGDCVHRHRHGRGGDPAAA